MRNIRVLISIFSVSALLLFTMLYMKVDSSEYPLSGKGTEDNPYLISSVDDLEWLRDRVNLGNEFANHYFLQTQDIDLQGEEWIPIGIFNSGNYFYGTYDGGNCVIENLTINGRDDAIANQGLFGQLGGKVINLGIESGSISGDFVGGIASHSIGNQAVIANCFNKATIIGKRRAAGICDNFSGGTVLNCVNYGEIVAPISAEIVSYNAKAILNVCPSLNAYTDSFEGTYRQFIDFDESDNWLDDLNYGIVYLEEELSIETGMLKTWKTD